MIHMQQNLLNYKDVEFFTGNYETIQDMIALPLMRPFSDEVIAFLDALSKKLLHYKMYSDVVTFGFWCRKAAVNQKKKNYDDLCTRLGRGIAFHIAPSNVAVNFAYSLVAGLLAGNANIVRLSSKEFAQVSIISDEINNLLAGEYKMIAPYFCLLKYPSQLTGFTDELSKICDSRIIWGGDATIAKIRHSQMKPRAIEIAFADRHSILVINADKYLKSDSKENIAQGFYNDTFFTDQNACTSPRLIVWMGTNMEQAKKEFWKYINELVSEKYLISAIQSVGKLDAAYKLAAKKTVRFESKIGEKIYRFSVESLDTDLLDFKYNSGFFFEYDANELSEIVPACNEKCQTMTYFGLSKEEIKCFLEINCPKGIDRIVPIGKSMDFDLVWDGYDLIRTLSRRYVIE